MEEDCGISNYFICNGYINYVECVENSFESDAHKRWKYSSQTKFCYMVNRSGIASVETGGFLPHSGQKLEKYSQRPKTCKKWKHPKNLVKRFICNNMFTTKERYSELLFLTWNAQHRKR
jgi:hypothetical protein